MPLFEFGSSPQCILVAGRKILAGQPLLIPWHMCPAQMLDGVSIDECTLFLKVQNNPKLEARIRNRSVYIVVPSLLLGLGKERVLVYVENAPSLVVFKILVLSAPCILCCAILCLDGSFYKRLRRASR
jgi:hypothetical protein